MASLEPRASRPSTSLGIAGFGAALLALSLPFGSQAIAYASVAFLLACFLALRDSTAPVLTWSHGIALLVLVVWLIPTKRYALRVELPFNLEIYRLLVFLLLVAWLASAILGRIDLGAGGMGKPLAVLAGGALLSQGLNASAIDSATQEGQALKSLSFFLSFLVVFLLVYTTIRDPVEIERIVEVLVLGGVLVALVALYEARTRYNLFTDLDRWIPFLEEVREREAAVRGGRLRAFASAQHPIALAGVLILTAPLGIYLAHKARSRVSLISWIGASTIIIAGAFATVSRTLVVMLIPMTLAVIWLRRRAALRFWPLLLILPVAIHFLAPGTIGTLRKSLRPGVIAQQQTDIGGRGSGRLADLGPGLELWASAPFFGHGLGSQPVTGDAPSGGALTESESAPIIFDNEYLGTLVALGIVGLIGTVWFVWGTVRRCGGAAQRVRGSPGALLTACAISTLGFAASMFAYDAFSFVQASLLFFVIAALGLRARELALREAEPFRELVS